jgi:Flp pilus assembly protein TadG
MLARDRGQAALEFAIALPLIAMLLVGFIQVAVVVGDQLIVELAAREGARAASVASSPSSAATNAAEASTSLRPLEVTTAVSHTMVVVTVRYSSPTDAPLLGGLIGDVNLAASVTMRREPP